MTIKISFAAILLTASTLAAHADTITFDFTANQIGFSASGKFIGTSDANGNYDITAIIGSVTEGTGFSSPITITGLAPTTGPGVVTTAGPYFYDNVYYPNPGTSPNNIYNDLYPSSNVPAFDGAGLVFVLSTGEEINLFDQNGDAFLNGANYPSGENLASESVVAEPGVAATPEPSSLVLLGTGILGMAGAARRRFRRS